MRRKVVFLAASVLLLFSLLADNSYAMKAGSFEISPFIAVTVRYSDNVFLTRDDTKSDFSTVISPGIQLVYPRAKTRHQLSLRYNADIEIFNRYSSENAVSHTAEGRFGMIFPMGLELSVGDVFRRSHDARGINFGPELDFFWNNSFYVSAGYSFTDRWRVQLDYTNTIFRYDAERNNFRNYTAHTFAGYLYYRFRPKASAFVEYEYSIVNFDESDELNGSGQHIFAGITWDVTDKTKGTVKAGFGIRDFDNSSISGYGGLILEATIDHRFNSKHSISLRALRATSETNLIGSDFIVSTALSAAYMYRITGKLTGKASIEYNRESYKGRVRKLDNTWRAGIGLAYQFKRWLLTEVGYLYTIRDSSVDDYDYRNNMYFLRVVGTL